MEEEYGERQKQIKEGLMRSATSFFEDDITEAFKYDIEVIRIDDSTLGITLFGDTGLPLLREHYEGFINQISILQNQNRFDAKNLTIKEGPTGYSYLEVKVIE